MPLAIVLLLAFAAPSPAPTAVPAKTYTAAEAATALRDLATRRPADLAPADVAVFNKHSAWLQSCSKRLDAVAGKPRTEMLALQNAMQHESRSFQMLSNIMKSQHQTAMAIIGNLR
ncbi:MAG: hypothetical protein EP329_05100 [Deltaproteobacteria bacterium]|nr:MAG: hypothetical protein EP329_05100 [Deltaproteobacteria bacterium]